MFCSGDHCRHPSINKHWTFPVSDGTGLETVLEQELEKTLLLQPEDRGESVEPGWGPGSHQLLQDVRRMIFWQIIELFVLLNCLMQPKKTLIFICTIRYTTVFLYMYGSHMNKNTIHIDYTFCFQILSLFSWFIHKLYERRLKSHSVKQKNTVDLFWIEAKQRCQLHLCVPIQPYSASNTNMSKRWNLWLRSFLLWHVFLEEHSNEKTP